MGRLLLHYVGDSRIGDQGELPKRRTGSAGRPVFDGPRRDAVGHSQTANGDAAGSGDSFDRQIAADLIDQAEQIDDLIDVIERDGSAALGDVFVERGAIRDVGQEAEEMRVADHGGCSFRFLLAIRDAVRVSGREPPGPSSGGIRCRG